MTLRPAIKSRVARMANGKGFPWSTAGPFFGHEPSVTVPPGSQAGKDNRQRQPNRRPRGDTRQQTAPRQSEPPQAVYSQPAERKRQFIAAISSEGYPSDHGHRCLTQRGTIAGRADPMAPHDGTADSTTRPPPHMFWSQNIFEYIQARAKSCGSLFVCEGRSSPRREPVECCSSAKSRVHSDVCPTSHSIGM